MITAYWASSCAPIFTLLCIIQSSLAKYLSTLAAHLRYQYGIPREVISLCIAAYLFYI